MTSATAVAQRDDIRAASNAHDESVQTRARLRLRSGVAPLITGGAGVIGGARVARLASTTIATCCRRCVRPASASRAGHGDVVPTSAQVFRMATENGARTTGFADSIGVLEPGRRRRRAHALAGHRISVLEHDVS